MNKFQPKIWKFSKVSKKKKFFENDKIEIKHYYLINGYLGLKLLESAQLDSKLLEVIRRLIAKHLKKVGKYWFFCHAKIPLTKKSIGVRMGKGAGSIDSWIFRAKKGKIIIELSKEIPLELGELVLNMVMKKLPVRSKIIKKI